jgi:hypothetical protein
VWSLFRRLSQLLDSVSTDASEPCSAGENVEEVSAATKYRYMSENAKGGPGTTEKCKHGADSRPGLVRQES